jgi:long-chain acyl-CoA synthetase
MFWELERHASGASAGGIYDAADRREIGYRELLEEVGKVQARLDVGGKKLIALLCDNSLASIVGYLAALRSGHAVMLINKTTDASLRDRLFSIYQPEIVISGAEISFAEKADNSPIHAETAALLSTSGTTGSPKLIRLSYRNLQANAESIVEYLGIRADERAITSLSMSYSYGLSVISSHLQAGAGLVCTNASVVAPEFWGAFKERGCTSFAGVPFSYGVLEKLRFTRMNLPSLRTMTQAGGRLAPEKIELFADAAREKGIRFFVMYGQTEATARISYVPPERLREKIGSVGIAIPSGRLDLSAKGELIYEGPNVMLGYAEARADLARGDEMGGRLATGDLGYRDADGFYYITGRLKRFIKMTGLRLNLDEVEKMLESALGCAVACAGGDESLRVVIESTEAADADEAKMRVIELYKLHHSMVRVHQTSALAVNASGKKDYAAIMHGLE